MDYLTEALILDKKIIGEKDLLIDLYSKDLGRIQAKHIGGRKITSKLASHLEPLNFSILRIVEKNAFRIADALKINELAFSKSLKFLCLFRELVLPAQADLKLWYWLKGSLKKASINYKEFLALLGYDLKLSLCQNCQTKAPNYFLAGEQIFLCYKCALKIPKNVLVLNIKNEDVYYTE